MGVANYEVSEQGNWTDTKITSLQFQSSLTEKNGTPRFKLYPLNLKEKYKNVSCVNLYDWFVWFYCYFHTSSRWVWRWIHTWNIRCFLRQVRPWPRHEYFEVFLFVMTKLIRLAMKVSNSSFLRSLDKEVHVVLRLIQNWTLKLKMKWVNTELLAEKPQHWLSK